MLDIGWQELFIIAVFAILVIGPKDLPRALKTIMHYVRKARGLAREFQSGVDEMVREADLDDLKKEVKTLTDSKGLENTIKDSLDPDGDLSKDMDLSDVQRDLDKTAKDAVKETEPESSAETSVDQVKDAITSAAPVADEAPSDGVAPEAPETIETADTKSAASTNST